MAGFGSAEKGLRDVDEPGWAVKVASASLPQRDDAQQPSDIGDGTLLFLIGSIATAEIIAVAVWLFGS